MAKVLISDQYLTQIGEAIRSKNGSSDTYTPAEMASAIAAISGGGSPILQNKTITPSANQQIITADNGYDGLEMVTINGDTNLISSNILSGVNIFGVIGNINLATYYSGDSDPSNSLGEEGDFYFKYEPSNSTNTNEQEE